MNTSTLLTSYEVHEAAQQRVSRAQSRATEHRYHQHDSSNERGHQSPIAAAQLHHHCIILCNTPPARSTSVSVIANATVKPSSSTVHANRCHSTATSSTQRFQHTTIMRADRDSIQCKPPLPTIGAVWQTPNVHCTWPNVCRLLVQRFHVCALRGQRRHAIAGLFSCVLCVSGGRFAVGIGIAGMLAATPAFFES